jgi:hypothetical protein
MDGDLKETNGNILTLRLFCHRLYIIPRPPYQSTLASKELGGDDESTPARGIPYGALYSPLFPSIHPQWPGCIQQPGPRSIFSKCFLKVFLVYLCLKPELSTTQCHLRGSRTIVR